MKNYFKSKLVITEHQTLSFVLPSQMMEASHYILHRDGDNELHVVECEQSQVADVLACQHPECEVEQQDFSFIENALKESRFYREIDADVVAAIRAKYSIDDELRIMKLAKTSAEYVAMLDHISECRTEGDAKKLSLGLKQ